MRAMAADDAAEGDRAVVAPLRIPAGVAARTGSARHEPDWISIMIGASSADMMISRQAESDQPDARRRSRARRPVEQRERSGRRVSAPAGSAIVSSNSCSARSASKRGQVGKKAKFGGEIFRPDVARLQHEHDADQQLRHPERRGHIAHDAGDEMLARGET